MRKMIVLAMVALILSGCSIIRHTRISAGAKGAKAKAYGELEAGTVVYEGKTVIKIFAK